MNTEWEWVEGPAGYRMPVATLDGKHDGPTWVFAAAVHGDEYEGPEAIRRAIAELSDLDFRGRVIALPVANPMAYRAGTRCTPDDGGNLNRHFPGTADGSLTARWADWLWNEFIRHGNRLIDLHAGGQTWEFEALAGFYHPDDAPFAAAFGFPLWQVPEQRGVLSREFRQRIGPAIGCELGFGGGRNEQHVVQTHSALVRLARGETGASAEKPYCCTNIVAAQDGEWITSCTLGQTVGEGDLLGSIWDWTGHLVEELRSPCAGRVITMRKLISVQADGLLVTVGSRD
jgi:predicted deacylase